MVLEELDVDDSYASDETAPSGWDSSAQPYTLDLEKLPKPVPIIGWLGGYGPKPRDRLEQVLAQVAETFPRPLRSCEAQAIAEGYSQIMATASVGDAIGLGLGAYQSYRKAQTFRFPFFQPNLETFNPDQLGPLRGQQARLVWHACRTLPYMILGMFVGDLLFRTNATLATVQRMKKDERLSDFNKVFEGIAVKKMEEVAQRRRRGGQASPQQGSEVPTMETSRSMRRSHADEEDNMSPTSGAFLDDYADTASQSTSRLADAQRHGTGANDQQYRAVIQTGIDRRQPMRTSDARAEDGFDLNAASSSNSAGAQSPLPPWASNRNTSRAQSQGSESSWDRLRREAQNPPDGRSPSSYDRPDRGQRQGTESGDSFPLSSSDEDRKFAQPEAQRDFDRRKERERRDKNF